MTNAQVLKKIFSEFIQNTGKTKFIFMFIIGVFYSFLAYLEPVFFTQIIKNIEEFLKTGIFEQDEFIKLMLFWGIFIISSITMAVIYRYFFVEKTTINNLVIQTTKYSKKIINMDYPTYLGKEVGKIYKRFNRGIEMQFNFLMFFLLEFTKSVFGIIFVISILFYTDVKMTLITLTLFPVMIIIGTIFFKKLFPTQRKLDEKWDAIYSDLGNIMSVFSLVKTLRLEKLFAKKINKKLEFCYDKQLKVSRGWAIADLYTSFFTTLSRFIVLGAGVYFIKTGEITFATLFLFFSYIGWIYFPLGFLFSRLNAVQTWISAMGIFYEEFGDLKSEYKDNNGKKILKTKGEIEFKDVSFAYTKSDIIKNMSFKVHPGEKVAFVGDTGAGKSTIVNLFLRFWGTNSGQILLDNHNIETLDLKSFRKHIGIVSQDNSLFNLSIKENLLFANKNATKKDLKEALKNAEANFVFDFDDGLDSFIGERGLKLSGGEKQRLSIARLFLKNPGILILDEATSALDNKTEKLIQKALDKLMKGRTSIVIAHRLSTVKNVDKIFVLKKGQIVESGNYNKLIKQKGEFYKLVNPDTLIIK